TPWQDAIFGLSSASPLLVCAAVASYEPRIHFLERVPGNAQRNHHLPACFFALAPLFGSLQLPFHGAAQYRREHQPGGEALPHERNAVAPLDRPQTAPLKDLGLQAWRRR